MRELEYHSLYTDGAAIIESDKFGRRYFDRGGRRYLVPSAAVPETPCSNWAIHERFNLAVPHDLAKRNPFRTFRGEPKDHDQEGGVAIVTVVAESLAAAQLMAAVCDIRIFGWGTGTSQDCSGRTFSSPADHFIISRNDFAEPGSRQKCMHYGFYISWSIDC